MQLSIIIPTLNEESTIAATLDTIEITKKDIEVILVDGYSTDKTIALSQPYDTLILQTEKGRARQMNEGAEHAKGSILLFLHADTLLPHNYSTLISRAILEHKETAWGYFDVALSGTRTAFRIIETMINFRTALSQVASGDQAIFVKRDIFFDVGGFPNIELMEDIAFTKRLKRISKPARIKQRVTTSSRRWSDSGIVRTILLMWSLRLAFYFGINPSRLKAFYK